MQGLANAVIVDASMPPDSGEQLTIDSLNNPGYYQSRNFCEREHDKRLRERVRAAEVSLLLLKRGRGSKPSKFVDSTKLINTQLFRLFGLSRDGILKFRLSMQFDAGRFRHVRTCECNCNSNLCSFSDFLKFLRLLLCGHDVRVVRPNAHMFAWSSQRVHNNMFNIIEYSTVSTTYQGTPGKMWLLLYIL